ncbi:MAG TPA: hypothetical protein DIT65_00310 [Cryomorphaceae bacterium]|nr:hypothetical protein [Cryomorphaceae bacterium]|tara:strand:+ start:1572 stop:1844 length:273 start_codon:yes stop_codon:yes gene_type:complete
MIISANIQFIPLRSSKPMAAVDKAIAFIQASGLDNEVGPFGTSIEGPKAVIQDLIDQLLSLTASEEFLLNVEYHIGENRLSNAEKVAKFR